MARRAIGLVAPKPLRSLVSVPRGPRMYSIPPVHQGGPGEPPPGFAGSHTTGPEWVAYWAIWTILGYPINPRLPPFIGFPPMWQYQAQSATGFSAGGMTRVDFEVQVARGLIAIRIQTEYFHQFTDSVKQAYDVMQMESLGRFADVVDVYDQDLLGDVTGEKAVVTMKKALGLIQTPNPIVAGTAIRASRLSDRIA